VKMIYRSLLFASFLVAAAQELSQTGTITCTNGHTLVGGACYFISEETHSGGSAEDFCQGYGGHAAVIESPQEMDLLKDSMLDRTVHLGVTASTSREKLFQCAIKLGEHSGYTNFHTGEPDNLGGEDCVVAESAYDFAWEDVRCTETHHVLCKTEATVRGPSCPDGGHLFGDATCFWLDTSQHYTWETALSACAERGMHLASVHSQAEQEFIWGLAEEQYLWFGLNDQLEEGHFIWSDGTAVNYTNWHSDDPNGGDNHDCGFMFGYFGGAWGDWLCKQENGVVCRGVPNGGSGAVEPRRRN